MSKGLEALKEIKSKPFSWEKLKDSLDTIEKELKALEIIIKKNVLPCMLNDTLEDYNNAMPYFEEELTQQEYDLLKEVLL